MAATKPNPQNTGERLTVVEQAMCNLEPMVNNLKTEISDLRKDMKDDMGSLRKEITAFIESADSRYASKQVEKIVNGAVTFILLAFLSAIVALVIVSK